MNDVDGDEQLCIPVHHLQFPSLSSSNASKKRPNITPQDWDDKEDADNGCEIELKRPNVMQKSHQIGNKAARFLNQMEQRANSRQRDEDIKATYTTVKTQEPSERDPSSEKSSTSKPNQSPTILEQAAKKPVGKLEYVINAVLSLGTENEHLRGQLDVCVLFFAVSHSCRGLKLI